MENLHTILTGLTIVIGVIAFLNPKKVAKLVGLSIEDVRGYIEIRSGYSGALVAMGIASLIINDPLAYNMLGILWLGTGIARLISILLARIVLKPDITLFFLISEITIGTLLIAF